MKGPDDPGGASGCSCSRKTCSNCAEREFWALYKKTQDEARKVEERYKVQTAILDRMMTEAQAEKDEGIRKSKLAYAEQKREELADWYHGCTYQPYAIPEPDPSGIINDNDDNACTGYVESDGSVYREVSPGAFKHYLRRKRRSTLRGDG